MAVPPAPAPSPAPIAVAQDPTPAPAADVAPQQAATSPAAANVPEAAQEALASPSSSSLTDSGYVTGSPESGTLSFSASPKRIRTRPSATPPRRLSSQTRASHFLHGSQPSLDGAEEAIVFYEAEIGRLNKQLRISTAERNAAVRKVHQLEDRNRRLSQIPARADSIGAVESFHAYSADRQIEDLYRDLIAQMGSTNHQAASALEEDDGPVPVTAPLRIRKVPEPSTTGSAESNSGSSSASPHHSGRPKAIGFS